LLRLENESVNIIGSIFSEFFREFRQELKAIIRNFQSSQERVLLIWIAITFFGHKGFQISFPIIIIISAYYFSYLISFLMTLRF